jgi:hypothetical protein
MPNEGERIMLKRCLSLLLAVSLIQLLNVVPAAAATKAEKEARFAGKVRASVLKLGTGESARVKIRLRDGTKLEGYVGEAGADSFTVVNSKTGAATTVAYPLVRQAQGNNLSTGAKIAIGVGIAALVLIILVATVDIGPEFN